MGVAMSKAALEMVRRVLTAGRPIRFAAVAAALALASGAPPSVLLAQVGHDPGQSPFRDIVTRQAITFFGGRFAGDRAEAGVGAGPGMFTGLRIESRLSGPLDFAITLNRIGSDRFVVDPLIAPPRTTGPIDYTLVAADAALQLNLTGAKSWHRLAPYVSLGMGIVTPTSSRTDNGGYKAGTNFTLVPGIGTRFYLSRNWALRVELRDYYFRYEWPLAYFSPIDASGNAVPDPVLPFSNQDRQWTHNAAVAIGLTWAFTF